MCITLTSYLLFLFGVQAEGTFTLTLNKRTRSACCYFSNLYPLVMMQGELYPWRSVLDLNQRTIAGLLV